VRPISASAPRTLSTSSRPWIVPSSISPSGSFFQRDRMISVTLAASALALGTSRKNGHFFFSASSIRMSERALSVSAGMPASESAGSVASRLSVHRKPIAASAPLASNAFVRLSASFGSQVSGMAMISEPRSSA
jgi:hypothetical protein